MTAAIRTNETARARADSGMHSRACDNELLIVDGPETHLRCRLVLESTQSADQWPLTVGSGDRVVDVRIEISSGIEGCEPREGALSFTLPYRGVDAFVEYLSKSIAQARDKGVLPPPAGQVALVIDD